ncbi:putative disease resistance protein At1g50180 [Macadamia integrifolia]|uniref:putative disease resistance protein At1g50180 n=1 Tax=Macadamia integrifolia TaxID=60698 RepID=UPI001C4FDF72|nr:putative disease resistance protein At1g50180 [Macadamia integrifolia]XP_042513887.1 putative disease resistance protein At1g50180 [Macadamia integrifolia]
MVLTPKKKKKWAAQKSNFLEKKLSDFLKEKKSYLLVLDDVWTNEDWDDLEQRTFLFQCDGQQCRVLLTTRHEGVARHADPNVEPYKLQPLEKAESLKLFWKVFFRSKDDADVEGHLNGLDKERKQLAKKIVNKCDGLPLAIVVLGSLLSEKRTKSFAEWEKVHKSVSWHLDSIDNVRNVLSLSYIELPSQYKLGFLYFGLFPDDTEIERDKLIRLWVAEGFLEQRGDLSMEDVAGECLEELMQRNLIQVAKWKSNGEPESFIIHDVLLSLAISEAKEGKFLNISSTQDALECYRRVALHSRHGEQDPIPYHPSSLNILRSLLCFTEMSPPSLCGQFKLLTVLDLEVTPETESLPKEIGNLILLKYFSLCGTGLKTLPPWVGDLFNLQTLDLRKTSIESLPMEILKLKKLRHLLSHSRIPKWRSDDSIVKSVSGICGYPPPTIRHLGDLRDLHTLWLRTGDWIEDGLQMLNKLKELCIFGNEGDGLMEKFGQALYGSLVKLLSLEVLHLQDYGYGGNLPSFAEHKCLYDLNIIGCLAKLPDCDNFPHSLTKLRLACGHLKEDMMVTLEKLPNLKNLTLDWHQYDGVVMKCSAGGFSKLEILILIYFDWLRYWIVEEGAMPNLRLLEMNRLFGLKWIPGGLRHIRKLQKLKLAMPKEFLERVKEGGEDWEKIKHVPSIITQKEEIPEINLKGFDEMERMWFEFTGQNIPDDD